MKCENCQKNIPDDSKFCNYCGRAVVRKCTCGYIFPSDYSLDEKLCPQCKKENDENPQTNHTICAPKNSEYEEFEVNGITFRMIKVEGGTFTMGCSDSDAEECEKPTHEVTVSDFSIGQTEVTQALWKTVMGNNPSYHKGDDKPVEKVSWDDCQVFIQKLNQLTSKEFRLPSEAEWEYAARGGKRSKGYKFAGSNQIDDVTWYDANSDKTTHSVATKLANELGLFDMSGNVWEWCNDWHRDYTSDSETNPTGPATGSYRVIRGSSWFNYARDNRVSFRYSNIPSSNHSNIGLRLAL